MHKNLSFYFHVVVLRIKACVFTMKETVKIYKKHHTILTKFLFTKY